MKHPSRLFLTGGLCALALAAGTAASSAQFVFQPLTEATSKDIKIYSSVPTGNFSSNIDLTSPDTGAHFLSLLQFDLSTLPLLSSAITSATLTLYSPGLGVRGGPGGGPAPLGGDVSLSPILNAWRENAADVGAAPLATYDAFFGATPTLAYGTAVATQTVSGPGFVTWDITNTVKSWVDGSLANYGLFIQLTSAGGAVQFEDVDSGAAGSAPTLTVVPEPSALALLGGSGLLFLMRRRRAVLA